MKHTALLSQLSLFEKAALLSGKTVFESRDIPRLKIRSIYLSDGPHGIRKQAGSSDHLGLNPSVPATCFPTAATVANSWDEALVEEMGRALGKESIANDVDVLLGPGLNIKRNPLCGRNFEYYSEDPHLSGKMAAALIRGIESTGVAACPKHFAVNNQELRRMANDSVLDERTLREIYLTGFEIAIKEGNPRAIMSSYNQINGIYANENAHLLQKILRNEWGFNGLVVTDWGGSNDHVAGVRNGSTLEMPAPGLDSARQLVAAVKSGDLDEADMDDRVEELLDIVLAQRSPSDGLGCDAGEQHQLARHVAEQSIVLLRNEEAVLPLKKGTRVAVIGDFAETPRYQGAGSSLVNATQLEIPVDCIKASKDLTFVGYAQGFMRNGQSDAGLQAAAMDLAKNADVVLVYVGLAETDEVEGLDRRHMKLASNQVELIELLGETVPNLVAVISAGAAIEMPWRTSCKAILHGYLGGQAGAGAVVRVLTGAVNPSGKLSETYSHCYEDVPSAQYFPGKERTAEYREGIYVGYRYYATVGKKVCYPFGFGLSYTTFSYAGLQTGKDGVNFTLTNTGNRAGAEIAQLYVGGPQDKVFRAKYELKGFCKVFLEPGESKAVHIAFDERTFRYFNIHTNRWENEEGTYTILVGASSEDIRLKTSLHREGTNATSPYSAANLPDYFAGTVENLPDVQFKALLGREIPDGGYNGELGVNDTLGQMSYAKSALARLVSRTIKRTIMRSEAKGTPNLNALFQYNMPFRAIAKMTNGMVSMEMVNGMLTLVNGRFFKGMRIVIGGFFRNKRANRADEKKLG